MVDDYPELKDWSSDDTEAPEELERDDGPGMSLWEHLEELRWVIIKSLVVVAIGMGAAFPLVPQIWVLVENLVNDLNVDIELIYVKAPDTFTVRLHLAGIFGFTLAIPFILLFVWEFVHPALKHVERKMAIWVLLGGSAFFVMGAALGYVVLGQALHFLVGMGLDGVAFRWEVRELVKFCVRFVLAFGIVFELPVVLAILGYIGIVQAEMLQKFRPYAVVLAFVLGALLTPADPYSQLMLAVPLVIMYEIGVLLVRFKKNNDVV